MVAASILRGEGFSYDVPSRSKGNQVCGLNPSPAVASDACLILLASHRVHASHAAVRPGAGQDRAARGHQPTPLRQHQHMPQSRWGYLGPTNPWCAQCLFWLGECAPVALTHASVHVLRAAVFTTRVLGLVHELCMKRIHVTKRDLFYTDVKLFEAGGPSIACRMRA